MRELFFAKYKIHLLVAVILLLGYFFFYQEQTLFFQSGALGTMEKVYSLGVPRHATEMASPVSQADGTIPEARRLEKTASLTLETEKEGYDNAKKELEKVPDAYKGYYTGKNEHREMYGEKEYRLYSITLKVPVTDFDAAISDVKVIAELKSMNVNMNDLTTQYYDTKAYLENYKKERARLEQLYERADKIEDLIKIEERLTHLQNQIDGYEARLKNIERTTDYASIYVTLSEKKEIVETYFEMTGIMLLLKNIVLSFDRVFVFLSNIIGWAFFVLIGWGVYRWIHRKKR